MTVNVNSPMPFLYPNILVFTSQKFDLLDKDNIYIIFCICLCFEYYLLGKVIYFFYLDEIFTTV